MTTRKNDVIEFPGICPVSHRQESSNPDDRPEVAALPLCWICSLLVNAGVIAIP
jgi:hypothetical protein